MEIESQMIDLVNAFNEGHIAGVHIDPQLSYYREFEYQSAPNPMIKTYPVINDFAQSLRELDI